MNTYRQIPLPRTHRPVSSAVIGPQAARPPGVGDRHAPPLWDHHVIDRLSAPISRIRE